MLKERLFSELFFRLAIGALLFLTAGCFRLFHVPAGLALIVLSIFTVLPIIFGDWMEGKLGFGEMHLEKFGKNVVEGGALSLRRLISIIFQAFVQAEALLPIFTVSGCLLFGYMSWGSVFIAVSEKWDIVVLILSFAVIALGLKQSGYFKYAAFRVLEVCDGKTSRLTLYLFTLSSILTYFTSNDIVILVMTPIVLSLCIQSGLKNAKLLLLGQFVAANTLSMGFLIGSPTNIIVSSEIGLDFFEYMVLMFIPSLCAIASGFVFIHGINKFTPQKIRKHFNWKYESDYRMPALAEQPDLTGEMRAWRGFFFLVVIAIAVLSNYDLPFYPVTLVAGSLAMFGVPPKARTRLIKWWSGLGKWWMDDPKSYNTLEKLNITKNSNLLREMPKLPWQIVFFAFAFFAIAESLAQQIPVEAIFQFVTDGGIWWSSVKSMIGTAALVNVVNDLPASALIGEVAAGTNGAMDSLIRTVFTQSILASLNIACYVTPIGALAGIIWFHIMQEEGKGIETPTRAGMIAYGGLHFVFVMFSLSILIPFFNLFWQFLSPENLNGSTVLPLGNWWVFWAGVLTLVLIVLAFLRILKGEKIVLGDLRAFLSAASWINVRSKRLGVVLQFGIAAAVLLAFGAIIWISEESFLGEIPEIEDVNFFVWVIVFLGSGYEDGNWFPKSYIGKIFAGMMPLVAIFLIIRLIQATRDVSGLEKISRRIARGEIVTRRSVIVDYRAWMKDFVREIWKDHDNYIFQTILYSEQVPPLDWSEERDYDDIYTEKVSLGDAENLRGIVEDYRLDRADEIYLLSERFCGSDGARWAGIVTGEISEILHQHPSRKMDMKMIAESELGKDPEDYAGRLPRIFIWSDVQVDGIGAEMESLLIRLPAEWREDARNKLISAVAGTAEKKSWEMRRKLILRT